MTTAEEILCLLRTCGPLPAGEVARRVGIERPLAYWTIFRLRLLGLIVRLGEWEYEVTDLGRRRCAEGFCNGEIRHDASRVLPTTRCE